MYLSDRDLFHAIDNGRLIVTPKPVSIDSTSIDLHLDDIETAMVWNIDKFSTENRQTGHPAKRLRAASVDYKPFSQRYLMKVPSASEGDGKPVYRSGNQIVICQGGLLLWQTKEVVGTPEVNAGLICFVDGKSTRARIGLVVHLTAPTIHSSWAGKITLEIANLGPFDIVLEADDIIAQLTVSTITSPPEKSMKDSVTYNQRGVGASTGA